MTLAAARTRSEATPSRAATPKPAPVVHRISSDSRRYGLSGRVVQPPLRMAAAHDPADRVAESGAGRVARGGMSQQAEVPAAGTPKAAPMDKAPSSPEVDPAFQAVVKKAKGVAARQRSHGSAKAKAKEAQDAAQEPAHAIESKAQAHQVGEMEKAEAPAFNAVAFKEALRKRIEQTAPTNLKEADEFSKNNKLDAVKGEITSKVKEEKAASQQPLAEKTKQAPDKSGIEPKSVTRLPSAEPGNAPPAIGAEQAVPKPKTPGEIEAPLQRDSRALNQQMAAEKITDEQLAKSNEPAFQAALVSKKEAQTHAVEDPKAYRQGEKAQLSQAQAQSVTSSEKQLQGMHGARGKLLAQVAGKQVQSKTEDEKARAKVASDLQQIYQTTKTKVERILSELDGKVERAFDAGAKKAKQLFEDYVDLRMRLYKAKRYSGLIGAGRWVKDQFAGMPNEVNEFYAEGRKVYLNAIDRVLDEVTGVIGRELTEAKVGITKGKKEIQIYVDKLPQDLKKFGQGAAGEIQSQFDNLENTVNSKQDALIDSLAQKYHESLKAIDDRINNMKEANKGLIDKAAEEIKGVMETFRKIKAMFAKLGARISAVVPLIMQDPIGFFKNLIKGLKQGFSNFVSNIGQHLQAGLIMWLTGALGPVGIQIPDDLFSLKGIFSLVMQILGLTWDYIRKKAVRLFGEKVVAAMEEAVEIFQIIRKEGPAGLWNYIKEQFTDLKEMVIGQIKEMVTIEIIKAGVKWILSLLNPVAALIKAAMAIYNIVMFFIERAAQIVSFLNSIIDAVAAIATGAVSGAAKLVETALAKSIPLIIGLLAALLGISGVAKNVQGIIQQIRKRIERAVDKLLLKARKLLGKVGATAESVQTKVFDFLKLRNRFKTKDGKSHTLSLKEKGNELELRVSSQEMTISQIISMLKKEQDVPAEQLSEMNEKAAVINKNVDRSRYKNLQAEEAGRERAIKKAMEELSILIAKFFGLDRHKVLPPSHVTFASISQAINSNETSVDGREMEAEPLTAVPGNTIGSQPSDSSKLWNKVSKRKATYIRGHLLSHRVHGPGEIRNLTPITGTFNTREMEPQVERTIKEFVIARREVIKFNVKVEYSGHPNRKTIPEEEFLPTKLNFKAYTMKMSHPDKDPKDPKSWVIDRKLPIPSSIEHHLPDD